MWFVFKKYSSRSVVMTNPPSAHGRRPLGWLDCIQRTRPLPGLDITTERDEYFWQACLTGFSFDATVVGFLNWEINDGRAKAFSGSGRIGERA